MKKLLIAVIALIPLFCQAQNVKPLTPEQQLEQAQKQLEEAQKAVEQAKANAQKAKKAAEEAKAKADAEKAKAEAAQKQRAKELAEKQAAIQEQIRKAQEEAARLNAEAEKLNAEAKQLNTNEAATQTKAEQPVVTSDQTKMMKNSEQPKQNVEAGYGSAGGWSAVSAPAPVVKQQTTPEDPYTDSQYLAGAVPVVDGKVVFTLNVDYSGKTASEIYEKAFNYINQLTVDDNQNTETELRSKIALVNQATHSIAAKMYEWITFSNSFIMTDRTEFTYTLVATCTDGHLEVTMERISYRYEPNRSTGFYSSAHEVIVDKLTLNKKQTKVVRPYGKFRIKTIDRKNEIFQGLSNLF